MSAEIEILRSEVAELKALLLDIHGILSARPATPVVFPPESSELNPFVGRELSMEEINREISRGNRRPLHEQNKRRLKALRKIEIRN